MLNLTNNKIIVNQKCIIYWLNEFEIMLFNLFIFLNIGITY